MTLGMVRTMGTTIGGVDASCVQRHNVYTRTSITAEGFLVVMSNIPHGTTGGYGNHKCRCDACKKAHRIACLSSNKAYRERNVARGLTTQGKLRVRRPNGKEPSHGTYARYQWRKDPCRCEACRSANAEYRYWHNKRKRAG